MLRNPKTPNPVIILEDRKASNVAGGTFTSGAWRTRTLNTIQADTHSLVSLSSNQFTIPAGTYRFRSRAPAYHCSYHVSRLYNITDSGEASTGSTEYSDTNTNGAQNASWIDILLIITATKTFELQHWCTVTETGDGLGVGGGGITTATTVFAIVTMEKIK